MSKKLLSIALISSAMSGVAFSSTDIHETAQYDYFRNQAACKSAVEINNCIEMSDITKAVEASLESTRQEILVREREDLDLALVLSLSASEIPYHNDLFLALALSQSEADMRHQDDLNLALALSLSESENTAPAVPVRDISEAEVQAELIAPPLPPREDEVIISEKLTIKRIPELPRIIKLDDVKKAPLSIKRIPQLPRKLNLSADNTDKQTIKPAFSLLEQIQAFNKKGLEKVEVNAGKVNFKAEEIKNRFNVALLDKVIKPIQSNDSDLFEENDFDD